jgi:rare lipoprotein A (peptidoglycan hydrolase)
MRPFVLLLASALACASPACAENGLASWYGWREHGQTRADGHPFNALGVNAASRTWPLGAHLRVTNLMNGRQAEVIIRDRGPYIKPRVLDVSLGTARMLGFEHQGVTMVRIEPVTPVVEPVTYTYRVNPAPQLKPALHLEPAPHHDKHPHHGK